MKKTRESHYDSPRTHVSLEELTDYIEDRLLPAQREAIDAFLEDNPLYQEALMSLQATHEVDPKGFEAMPETERSWDKYIEQAYDKAKFQRIAPGISDPDIGNREETYKPTASLKYPSNWVKWVASFVIVAGLAVVITQGGFFKSPAIKLVEANLVHYNPGTVMSTQAEKAYGLYNKHEYQEAIPAFHEALKEEDRSDERLKLMMYLGVCYTQIKKYQDSIPQFQSVRKSGESPYFLDASWYLALVYVKLDWVDKALPILEAVESYNYVDRHQKEIVEKSGKLLNLIRKESN